MIDELKDIVEVYLKKQYPSIQASAIFVAQLSELLYHVFYQILSKSESVKVDDIHCVMSFFFEGDLLKNTCKEGEYYAQAGKHTELTFSLSAFLPYIELVFAEKEIEFSGVCYIAGLLEYLLVEILDLAHAQCAKVYEKKLVFLHLQRALYFDRELSLMCRQFQIEFVYTGEDVLELKETQKMLKMMDIKTNKKTEVFLHKHVETYVLDLLKRTRQMCNHFGKPKIEASDIVFIFRQMEDV